MKIFAVRDGAEAVPKDLAYLFYYEHDKKFYIELPEHADPWETPLLLSTFAKKGIQTIDSYWSKRWVEQRIIPPDRQNIGQILRDNGLSEYDEFQLLLLTNGRCAQDEYYLFPMTEADLPKEIQDRSLKKVTTIIPLHDFHLLVFFRNGVVKKCNLKHYFEETPIFSFMLKQPENFMSVKVQTGGYGIAWDINLLIPSVYLYRVGEDTHLTLSDFQCVAKQCRKIFHSVDIDQ